MEAVINTSAESINDKSAKWSSVCKLEDITPDTGVCVLLDGKQIAIFRERKNNQVFAVSNYDPIGEANVLSRGILCSVNGVLAVASPLYKQHFNLATGQCLEDENYNIQTYLVRVDEGSVQLSL